MQNLKNILKFCTKLKLKYSKLLDIESYFNKLKAFLKRIVLRCFLKMARQLLILTVNGSEFHKTGAA